MELILIRKVVLDSTSRKKLGLLDFKMIFLLKNHVCWISKVMIFKDLKINGNSGNGFAWISIHSEINSE